MTPAQHIKALGKLQEKLATLTPFYAQENPRWLRILRKVSEQWLKAQRPQSVSAEEWAEAVRLYLSYLHFTIDEDGTAHFRLGANPKKLGADGKPNPSPQTIVVTSRDIQSWIDAGLEDHPLGKEITAIDMDLLAPSPSGESILAHKLYNIFHGHLDKHGVRSAPNPRFGGLREAITKYLGSTPGISFAPFESGLLTLWETTLTPIVTQEAKAYIHKIALSTLKA